MSQADIFKFRDYKEYLHSLEEDQGRGFRARIARKLNCQSAYISQVLGSEAHFTLEHADLLNQLLGHSEVQAQYLLLLVQYSRAGSMSLRKHFLKQIEDEQHKRSRLKERLQISGVDDHHQSLYYSSWKYPAIHVAISLPDYKSPNTISEALGISLSEVRSILEHLIEMRLIVEDDGWYSISKHRVHLADNSPFISQHHSHWRYKALESLNHSRPEDQPRRLHYSSVVTLSKTDIDLIREHLVKQIESTKSIIRGSEEEEIYGFNLDFYPVECH